MREVRASACVRAVCLCLLCSSCAPALPQGKAREAITTVPETYVGSTDPTNSAEMSWQEFFDDPHLVSLIDLALENNQELNIAVQEILITNNEVMARKGEYLPKVDLTAEARIDKVGKRTSQGASDEQAGLPDNLQHYGVQFVASWEVDIWKKLHNAAKAAVFRYLSSIEGRNFMVTQLVAEIASSYYELMALDSQLEVLQRNIEIQEDALELVKLEKQAARTTELAVQRFQAEVLKNQSRQYDIKQQIVETENRINFLVGRFPQHVERSSETFPQLAPKSVDAGLPTQLLENRPDVRRAELELEAAKLDVKVAKAMFYPSLSIDAGVGLESFDIGRLVQAPEALLYGIGAKLFAPLLNRRKLKAKYFSANSKQMQAVLNYERTILAAYRETANQLAMIGNLEKTYELRSKEVDTLKQAISISTVLFRSARADYLEVLTTRRDALNSQIELIETKRRQMNAVVNIYQALGGGWRPEENEQTETTDTEPTLDAPAS